MFALVDGNNFYVSCERVFRPDLQNKPVIVLSNNDGCAISRSNEAKALGVRMGQPWFEIEHLRHKAGLVALSANFALYGDLSDRVMSLAAELGPRHEVYSIDECFISLDGVRGDLRARAQAQRDRILRWVGIPCGIGIGPTKTLAKLANHIAKTAERKPEPYPRELAQVCDLSTTSPATLRALLAATPVTDVWGIGPRLGRQLASEHVHTALDLARLDPAMARKRWSVTMEHTVRELQGTRCFELEDHNQPRQQIAYTRSFGQPVSALAPLVDAVSVFTIQAAHKLRAQGSVASVVLVFIRTSPHRSGRRCSRSITVHLAHASADTRTLVEAAVAGLHQIYQPGYLFTKAGVMLLSLQDQTTQQDELDLWAAPTLSQRQQLMGTIDRINARWGRGTLALGRAQPECQRPSPRAAAQAHAPSPPPPAWAMRQRWKSPEYTTSWDQIKEVRA